MLDSTKGFMFRRVRSRRMEYQLRSSAKTSPLKVLAKAMVRKYSAGDAKRLNETRTDPQHVGRPKADRGFDFSRTGFRMET